MAKPTDDQVADLLLRAAEYCIYHAYPSEDCILGQDECLCGVYQIKKELEDMAGELIPPESLRF